MALLRDLNYKSIPVINAYCRISTVLCQKETGINFQVDVYYNEASRQDSSNILCSFTYNKPIDLNTETNIIEECYIYLKTNVPDWSGAIDSL